MIPNVANDVLSIGEMMEENGGRKDRHVGYEDHYTAGAA